MLGFVTTTILPAGVQGQGAARDALPDAARGDAGTRARDFLSFIDGETGTMPDEPAATPAPVATGEAAEVGEEAFTPIGGDDLDGAADEPDAGAGDHVREASGEEMAGLPVVGSEPDSPVFKRPPDPGPGTERGIENLVGFKKSVETVLEGNAEQTGAAMHFGAGAASMAISAARMGGLPQTARAAVVDRLTPASAEPETVGGAMKGKAPVELVAPKAASASGVAEGEIIPPVKSDAQADALAGRGVVERAAGNAVGPQNADPDPLQPAQIVSAERSLMQEAPSERPVPVMNVGVQRSTASLEGVNTASPAAVDAADPMRHGTEAALGLDPVTPRAFAEMRQAALANGQPVARHIAVQVAEAAAKGTDRAIDILLNPSELGRVRITVTHGESGLLINVAAERPETLDLMRRNGELLGRSFEEMGQGGAEFTFSQEERRKDDTLPEAEHGPATPLLLIASSDTAIPALGDRMAAVDRLDIRL